MATFLALAFDLQAATRDHLSDDGRSPHEDSINRLAHAGIALGITATTYSPDRPMTRGQMASMFARTLRLDLTDTTVYTFTDGAGAHLPSIHAIGRAGISKGCTAEGDLFCPDAPITRGQMATMLARVLPREW